ncbi:MAG: hypothetical protein ONB05_12030 [candidate division KSB1 bacterium]|nr:hypothetical protein [candidate division KSB1 bacterium]
MAQIFDAHLVFFPVHSMIGSVWVTSPSALKQLVEGELLTEETLDIKLDSESNQV